jgi:chromosome partitioning protein
MKIISLINYKGGVGKTTITANLGAQLAKDNLRVLMVDMDPQTSLTFSFVAQDEWQNYQRSKTIKNWFDAYAAREDFDFSTLTLDLPKIDKFLSDSTGKLKLISSHLDLINIDLRLAQSLGSGTDQDRELNYLEIFSRLKVGLNAFSGQFDVVLIDCPPNFNVVTRTAIAASDFILVPTKADYLSTIGFENLLLNVREFQVEFNQRQEKWPKKARPMNPEWLGIIFTMVNLRSREPIRNQRGYVRSVMDVANRPPDQGGLGRDITFDEYIRENKTEHSTAPEDGIPVVLGDRRGATYEEVRQELRDLATAVRSRMSL